MKKISSLILMLALPALLAACSRPSDNGGEGGGSNQRTLIQNKGSDTLVNVAQAWAENYKDIDPNVAVAVTGGGSGTGISALINGTVDLASASRKMKDKEKEMAEANGVEPVEHVVGFDALAVFLHHDNPANSLSIKQLAEIYGEGGTTETWSQVLEHKIPGCDSDEIVRVSRQNNSGTYVYFKEAVLGKERDYKLGSRDMHGSKDVVDLVEKTPCAIGYSGLAYAVEHIKLACIDPEDTEDTNTDESNNCVVPSTASALDGSYPIARPLLMYTRGEPTGATKAYLDWILSDVGQCIIQDKGYAPVRPVTCG